MAEEKAELGWTDLKKMATEVGSDHGPGSKDWKAEGSETKRVNDLFMRALRENNGTVPGELEGIPALIITTTGVKTGKPRAVPLGYQIVDGRLLIIAVNGRRKEKPAVVLQSGQKPGGLCRKRRGTLPRKRGCDRRRG